jgi:Tol biopolymer transport system component
VNESSPARDLVTTNRGGLATGRRFFCGTTATPAAAIWPETGLATVNVDGTGHRPVRSLSNEDWSPAWSPDGNTIAFNSEAHGKAEIYAMRTDGTGIRRLTRNVVRDFDPVWPPDGEQILFTTGRTGLDEVYRMNADGTRQSALRVPRASTPAAAIWRP